MIDTINNQVFLFPQLNPKRGRGTVHKNGFNEVILNDFSEMFQNVSKWLLGPNNDV